LAEAEEIYRRVLARDARHADAMHLLSNNLQRQGRTPEAVPLLEQVVALQPQGMEAHYNLGGVLKAVGRYDDAARSYERVLDLRPDFVEAMINLGNTLKEVGRLEEAERWYLNALELRPDFFEATYNLARLRHEEGRVSEAIGWYRRTCETNPAFIDAHTNYIYWLNFDPSYSTQTVFDAHLEWARAHAEPLQRLVAHHGNDPSQGRRLRVGYVSPNFTDHPAAYFFESTLVCHDPQGLETYCYSDVTRADDYTARFRQLSAHWRDCACPRNAPASESRRCSRSTASRPSGWKCTAGCPRTTSSPCITEPILRSTLSHLTARRRHAFRSGWACPSSHSLVGAMSPASARACSPTWGFLNWSRHRKTNM
jgi:protein O-GlcNAc transferase